MSVENVPDANRQWFVLRVLYGRIIKAKAFVEAKGFECYVPMRYKDYNPPLTIQNEAMNNFIRLTSIKNPHIIPITSDNIQFKLGDNVVVTEGKFKGIHGRVARITGQQRVVVELFEGYLVATAYIPKDAIKIIND